VWSAKAPESARVKSSEIIADNLTKAGWNWACVSAVDSHAKQSGLLTRIAAESGLLRSRMKS